MKNSLFGKRATFRGDRILHQDLETRERQEPIENTESRQEFINQDAEEISSLQNSPPQISSSIIAPSSSITSEDVISCFTQKHGGTIKKLPEEPILLVANKNPNHSVDPKVEHVKKEEREAEKKLIQNLPTGHRVEIGIEDQEIQVFDPDEKLQVVISLTESGPIVQVDGAKIQMRSASDIDMKCDNLRIHTNEDLHLNANRELTIESTEELHINCETDIRLRGKLIWLN